jgi:hypothetical protein
MESAAEPEFEKLDMIGKGKAVAFCAQNIVALKKVPALVRSQIEHFKDDFK